MTTTPRRAQTRSTESERDGESGEADSMLSVRNLRKVYGSGDEAMVAVDGVSFDVQPGTVVGLLGPNGAGKTTLIKSVLGLVVPTGGEATVAGIDVHGDTREAYQHVGAMLEGARNVYWKLTVRENLEFFAAVAGESPAALRDRHDALLDQLGLAEKADVPVNELSRGQKQKTALACALARDAEVAFLDEPTLGLDVESSLELRREIRRLAEREGMTILLSSHDMAVVEDVCDRVLVLNDGEIVADDAVDALVDAFESDAYAVSLDGPLAAADRDRLRERYRAVEFDGERLTLSLREPDRFYDLVDDLRETGRTIVDVDSLDSDLESAFVELTENGTGSGETIGPATGEADADD